MKSLGDEFEDRAALWLQDRGLRIVAKNYRTRTGEIDLVALHGDQLVFVEVRVRRNPRFCSAAASVDRPKQVRILRAAQRFLQQHSALRELPCRFDVVAFEAPQSGDDALVRWIKAAFIA